MRKCLILCLSKLIMLLSCAIEPQPIEYGKDACHYCKMNIVDRQHAAQIVTKKGRAFKYDASECMLRDLNSRDESGIALFLITDYGNPGKLVDATKSTYLISEALPSPMGANLTGFAQKISAVKLQQEKAGSLFTWDEVRKRF